MATRLSPRPAIATFFGVVSLIWSISTLGTSLILLLICSLVGVGSWLGGPVVGVLGTALSMAVAVYLIFSSFLSFLLLSAGWLTLQGDPQGVTLHRTWAWISLVLDTLSLLFTGGLSPGWFGLGYAIAVLYFTTPREVESRWGETVDRTSSHSKPNFPGHGDF